LGPITLRVMKNKPGACTIKHLSLMDPASLVPPRSSRLAWLNIAYPNGILTYYNLTQILLI
jgi:hypothetical protein